MQIHTVRLSITLYLLVCASLRADPIPPIQRYLPPTGLLPPNALSTQLQERLSRLRMELAAIGSPANPNPDVEIYLKAVDYALRHREFYKEKDFDLAARLLDQAATRIAFLQQGKTPWENRRGLVVRGYRSSIDGSAQPYGMVIPKELDLGQPAPLYVWLHGRGDKTTDLHFIHTRQTRLGRITPPGAIVLHPFGRHCVGFKHAGEIDVLEAIESVCTRYQIDTGNIVLMGFSMGGAGVWHIGAHYTDRFTAVSPGAGFAETARYNRFAANAYPVWYSQKLWTTYDVPNYARNFINLPVVAYSGEHDKQMQAARVMETAFASHGQKLTHFIGPKMGHNYDPHSLSEILRRMQHAVEATDPASRSSVHLQTRTLRYNRMHSVQILEMKRHWDDTRVDTDWQQNFLTVQTRNVVSLRLDLRAACRRIVIDNQTIALTPKSAGSFIRLTNRDGSWQILDHWKPLEELTSQDALRKRPGLQGPIDDAFLTPFIVVTPSQRSKHSQIDRWVKFELKHLSERWRALMRGELPVKQDIHITAEDIRTKNLILWGDVHSNQIIADLTKTLPIEWNEKILRVGEQVYSAAHHIPAFIYPNPRNPGKYVVFNSGLTFREGHDRTNSLQNPKLPDWAVIDTSQAPDALMPGKVVRADFFDESWRLITKPAQPHRLKVHVPSSIDATEQPCYVILPPSFRPGAAPTPLLVSLHSWSAGVEQRRENLEQQAAERGWICLLPHFRGPNNHPHACGSELAQQDILDAIHWVQSRYAIDARRIYLTGVSGGGHMTMLMAARHPDLWAAASAWVGISDLKAWHRKHARTNYGRMIRNSCSGVPGDSEFVDRQYRNRSPLTFLHQATGVPLDIAAGVHDGHQGSVPIRHSIDAFNTIARSGQYPTVSEEEIQQLSQPNGRLTNPQPSDLVQDPAFGRPIYLRRRAARSRITIFEGGHEGIDTAAIDWLAQHSRGAKQQK